MGVGQGILATWALSLALALALYLLAVPRIQAKETISAVSLSGTGTLAPELVSLIQLDAQIAANRDTKLEQDLALQRHQVLEQLTGRIFSGDAADLVANTSTETLRRLRDEVERARHEADRDKEMTAILKLNTAVLDAAFAQLLGRLSQQWSSFAPTSAFDLAFTEFRQRTSFDPAPFDRDAAAIEAMPASERSPDQAALIAAHKTYEQRSNSYNAVIASLQTFLSKAAGGDRLLRGLGVGTAIDAVNALPGITDVNAELFPSGRLTLGQVATGIAVFAALIGIGLLLLPLLVRALGWMVSRVNQSMAEEQRFTKMLQKSLDWPLRVLLLLFTLNTAGRIVLLRAPDTGLVNALAILVVLIVVWAILRLIDNAVATFSEQLRKGHPNLRGELVNFVSNMARITVVIITALYLLRDLGYDISTLLASLGIGGLAVAFAAKETIANIFGCISIIADDMFRQGDWIVTPEANGTVIDVGLRSTKIRTFDNSIIFLPNAYVARVGVRNWSRRKLGRRILLTIRLEYGSDMKMVRKTVDDIRTMLTDHPGIADSTTDTSQYTKQQLTRIVNAMDTHGVLRTLQVYLDELGESSINIMVKCFSTSIVTDEWLKAKQDVIFRCCEIVTANGLSIAFPSRTLYMREDQRSGDPLDKTWPSPLSPRCQSPS